MANEHISFENLTEYDGYLRSDANILERNKNYSTGVVVNKGKVFLKCTQAGITGSNTLSLVGVSVGDTLTDGTVTWEVMSVTGAGFGGDSKGLEDWKANHSYKETDIFVYDGQIYKSLVGFTSGNTFEQIEISEDYELLAWQANTSYVIGDIFIESDTLYKVVNDFTSGATFSVTSDIELYWEKAYQEGVSINVDEIFTYDGNYYKALIDFTCGKEFTKIAFEEYVPKSLTDEEVEEVINSYTPEFSGGIGGGNYSTEEQVIGTWIDGKPLYQRTYQVSTPMSANTNELIVPLDDSVTVHEIKGVVRLGNTISLSVNYFMSTNNFSSTWRSDGGIHMQLQNLHGGYPADVTVKYTKTTD